MSMPITWKRPSLARTAIEQKFPGHAIDATLHGAWDSSHLQSVKFLLDMLSNVDDRILFATLSPEQGLDWRRNLAAIQAAVRRWQSGAEAKLPFSHVVEMYGLLGHCPNEIVPKAEPRLTFIADAKFRTSIARDIDSLNAFVKDEEWKAATVIGGSVVEALLLDKLSNPATLVKAQAVEAAHVAAKEKYWRAEALEDWKLWKLIVVAQEVGLIDENVAHVCDGARDFRNLIHPTKERSEAPCDRGTALAAVAAVENLVAVFGGSR